MAMLLGMLLIVVMLHRVPCLTLSMCLLLAHMSCEGVGRGTKLWGRSCQLVVCWVVVLRLILSVWPTNTAVLLASPLAHKQHQYSNNNVTLQAAQCNLGKPKIYLLQPGDTVHSVWARIQPLVNMLTADTNGHKISECSHLIILATAL
jgi:hypothetical protein